MSKVNALVKKFVHPFLLKGVSKIYNNEIIVVDESKLSFRNSQSIFVANHTNGYDFPMVSQVINEHFFILADYTMKKDFLVNILNRINGCIYVDRKSRQSKREAKQQMIAHLKQGHNVLLFPEGTWNLHPSKLLLPLNWGVIDISKETGVPIIPIILLYSDKKVYVKIGKPFIPLLDRRVEISNLEAIMSTMMWDLMLNCKTERRDSIPPEYERIYIEKQLVTYKKFDLEYETSVIRK